MTATRSAALPSPLTQLGSRRHANLSVPELYEHAVRASEGVIAHGGPLLVRTGQHTGRSPQDKYIVDTADAHEGVWWGGFNRPISEDRYDALRQRMIDHLSTRELFVRDCYVGAHPRWRRSVRAYTEAAWASIFCSNLFRMPPAEDLPGFTPDFTIVDAPSFRADPQRDGHPGPSGPPGDPHRRHGVRRRDQEGCLWHPQLSIARRGRAAHALLGQRWRGG